LRTEAGGKALYKIGRATRASTIRLPQLVTFSISPSLPFFGAPTHRRLPRHCAMEAALPVGPPARLSQSSSDISFSPGASVRNPSTRETTPESLELSIITPSLPRSLLRDTRGVGMDMFPGLRQGLAEDRPGQARGCLYHGPRDRPLQMEYSVPETSSPVARRQLGHGHAISPSTYWRNYNSPSSADSSVHTPPGQLASPNSAIHDANDRSRSPPGRFPNVIPESSPLRTRHPASSGWQAKAIELSNNSSFNNHNPTFNTTAVRHDLIGNDRGHNRGATSISYTKDSEPMISLALQASCLGDGSDVVSKTTSYCLERPDGTYTRLVPVDLLPPLEGITAREALCEGMVVLPTPDGTINGRDLHRDGIKASQVRTLLLGGRDVLLELPGGERRD
jgi:hypothetical protein